jgi:SAM-dependent methyltransferase
VTDDFWSQTDFSYACLIDKQRVAVFERALSAAIRGGETVVDVGAGSGILSLLAARAGARKVYAVEIEPLLASSLRTTVRANGFESVIEVVEGDATQAALPLGVDVVVAELIETWLLDEAQVPVVNALRESGVIGPSTRVIPERYQAFIELVQWDNTYYGFKVAQPKHAWPNYENEPWWWQTPVVSLTEPIQVFSADFTDLVSPSLSERIDVARTAQHANAVRLTGRIELTGTVTMTMSPTINGPKVLLLPERLTDQLCIEGRLGGGLGSLSFPVADVT